MIEKDFERVRQDISKIVNDKDLVHFSFVAFFGNRDIASGSAGITIDAAPETSFIVGELMKLSHELLAGTIRAEQMVEAVRSIGEGDDVKEPVTN